MTGRRTDRESVRQCSFAAVPICGCAILRRSATFPWDSQVGVSQVGFPGAGCRHLLSPSFSSSSALNKPSSSSFLLLLLLLLLPPPSPSSSFLSLSLSHSVSRACALSLVRSLVLSRSLRLLLLRTRSIVRGVCGGPLKACIDSDKAAVNLLVPGPSPFVR